MSLIVILDDQVTNRKIFSKLAASIEDGARVEAFGEPQAALDWTQQNIPDLVVTDFKMPGMDGAEFIRRFRQQADCGEIPVIVITVYEERSFRMRALEAGATDFLQSPVDYQEFMVRARNLLKLRKQQLQLATHAHKLEEKLEDSERSRRQAIRDSRERLAQVIDTVPAMVSATDRNGKFLFVNAYQASMAGRDSASIVGNHVTTLFGEEHGGRSCALDRKVFETGMALPSFEEEVLDNAGLKHIVLTTKSPLRDSGNTVVGVLTSSLDITERKQAERHLLHMAHYDALTDLPNRTLLRDRLRREIARARRGDRSFALHIADLDGFKSINDVMGHAIGDKYLKVLGDRLQGLVRETDSVARLGGDEFAILQTNVARNEDAAELARRVVEAVSEPITVAGATATLSTSIGIAMHPSDGDDVNELLKNADLAMYRAKSDGGNVYRFYAADMDARAREAVRIDNELREAVNKQEFLLYYQPQVDSSGRIVGAEALLSWNKPGRGPVAPGEFLSRAEENGLILPINEWVLHDACRTAVHWRNTGLPPIRVAVNLSPIQFRKQNVPLLVAKVLAETGLEPARLDLELVESIMMDDTDKVASELKSLHDLGVDISIDDFGTGYSSLNYVKRFPAKRLKIDQCFIRDLATNPNDAAIVRAIVSMGHSLDLKIVAEGVETIEQLTLVRAEGCDEMQGYYFGKPMPAAEFEALLRRQPRLARSA